MAVEHCTLLIIGGGPGGYVAAIRAAQAGIATTLVEREALGGTCLNVGCIPSKALIHVAERFHQLASHAQGSPLGISVDTPQLDIGQSVGWKNGIVERLTGGVAALLKKHKVNVVQGTAQIIDGKTVEVAGRRLQCEHLLLATGSETVALPNLPWGPAVISSTQALSPTRLPRRLVVVGAGYIGLELGLAYRKLGVEVAIVEAREHILPGYERDLSQPVADTLKHLGVELYLAHTVEHHDPASGVLKVRTAQGEPLDIAAEQVLVAVGRRPLSEGFGLQSLGLDMQGAAVRIDAQCRTSMRNVWAIGDLTGEPMLAHRAMAQGEMVADLIAGQRREFNPASIAAVCFTDPEIVCAGLSQTQAQAQGLEVLSGQFPFAANGRAMTLQAGSGFVRVVARSDNHLIVGWQAVGVGVSELAAAFAQSLEMGARLEDIAGTIHAHPTLGEAIQEAAMRALGHALHL